MFARVRFCVSFHKRRTGIEFSFLFICFVLPIHNVCASPTDQWQLSDVAGASSSSGQNYLTGFECGNDFFSNYEINEALITYHRHFDQNRPNPLANHASPVNSNVQQYPYDSNDIQESEDFDIDQFLNLEDYDTPIENNSPQGFQNPQQPSTPIIYQGPLYSDSGSLNYILWPIQKEKTIPSSTKYSSEPYYIVINKQNGKVVDVISRIKNNDLTKCIRMDSSWSESSAAASNLNNGYQCASEFLSDKIIQKSLSIVVAYNGKFNAYPTSYFGHLYPANNGYMIWPIYSGNGLYDYNSVEVGPYFLVIDRQGNFIGTVVEGLSGNFLRCPRSRKSSKIPPLNIPDHFSEPEPKPAPKSGYFCGRNFFSDESVSKSAKTAKFTKETEAFRKNPAEFNGPPFNKPLLLWPLLLNGQLYERGPVGIYRVVLTKTFEVIAVGFLKNKILRLCNKVKMDEVINHEKSSYFCLDHLVRNHQLVAAAEKACSFLYESSHNFYPARYEGPSFDKTGPYFTYPLMLGNSIGKPSLDRVVINLKCEVVGALATIPKRFGGHRGRRFVQCIKDLPGLKKDFIEPNVAIAEYSGKGRY